MCTSCGSVLEEGLIVSEVGYIESAGGGASVAIGQFVSADGSSRSQGGAFRVGPGRESREVTLQNGRRRIADLAQQLSLHSHHVESAFRYFKLAVINRLTRGRKANHIAAACLYLVCRVECTSHMLLDFSDALQENVFLLGRAYLRLATALNVQAPALDPCLYIARFAHKLEFGERTSEVMLTAYRLVGRMKRDWMQYGRRPAGLCGAALLVAARLHNFSRSQKDIIKVVRVCDATLKKRLAEFERTPSSSLTIDEFLKIDLEEESDPPSFQQSRTRGKNAQLDTELEGEISRLEQVIDDGLAGSKDGGSETAPSDGEANTKASSSAVPPAPVTNAQDMNVALSAANLGNVTDLSCYANDEPAKNADGVSEEPLDDLDENEINSLILTEPEVAAKTRLWMEENREYLKQMKQKAEREEADKASGIERPKKKRKLKVQEPRAPCRTATEAIERVFVERKLSKKINYDVLRDLETELSKQKPAPEVVKPETALAADVLAPPSLPVVSGNDILAPPSVPVVFGNAEQDQAEMDNHDDDDVDDDVDDDDVDDGFGGALNDGLMRFREQADAAYDMDEGDDDDDAY